MTRARSVPFRRAGCALVALALLATGCGSSDKGDGPAAPSVGVDLAPTESGMPEDPKPVRGAGDNYIFYVGFDPEGAKGQPARATKKKGR